MSGIAIVGMSGRFPGAKSVKELWDLVREGRESIRQFSWDEIDARDPAVLSRDPSYVRARGVLDGVADFDAPFFGVTPREAELMDPQHRVFLELCWEVLEDAGWDPARYPGSIGIFAGQSLPTYFLANLASEAGVLDRITGEYQVGSYPSVLGNDKDYLATRASYKLDLSGPSMTIQSACSTSLVAVAQAVSSLLAWQCDMAIAGGVSITFPERRGYAFQEGGMVAPDGHCRPFDKDASGTVFSSGAGVVLLKRLEDALTDRDNVVAVIQGAALNNDGQRKVGFMAPSPHRQAEVIATAHAIAGFDPSTIGLVETHGTGTPLGDPIEFEGLSRAFRAGTDKTGFCALGTLKANTGHMEVAAGVSGLIKTALCVREGVIPPAHNYTASNPKIDLPSSPFYLPTELRPWPLGDHPRRAGVSAFGVGGTNAHVVLEEAPRREDSAEAPVRQDSASEGAQLLVVSARSESALQAACRNLSQVVGEVSLGDAAFTLGERRAFSHRRFVVAKDPSNAAEQLRKPFAATAAIEAPQVVFLMPGQGAQHAAMGAQLYARYEVFREEADRCLALLADAGTDLRGLLFRPAPHDPSLSQQLMQTAVAQPALFVLEVALARLWQSFGVKPSAFVGHSVGEFAAAALSGVMPLGEAARLVAARGALVQALPRGSMLSVRLPALELGPLLGPTLSIASENGPSLSVAAGPTEDIEALERALSARKVVSRRLRTSHAFHSAMMDAAVGPFGEKVRGIQLQPSSVPIVSTLFGRVAEPSELADAGYWTRHLREAVRFYPAVKAASALPGAVFLEVGPGRALSTLARQAGASSAHSSLPEPSEEGADEVASLLEAAGRLFCAGVPISVSQLAPSSARRVSLPTYPFERKRHFIEPAAPSQRAPSEAAVQPDGVGSASDDPIESLVQAQLELMRKQLEALGTVS
ncbi:MAG TPA: type I polyketide synthase [Myxococcales bacterium]|jgi:acyl transferase domain-containing protein